MKLIRYPDKKNWARLTERPAIDQARLFTLVDEIFSEISKNGDLAVKKYSQKFDKSPAGHYEVKAAEIKGSAKSVSKELQAAIKLAKRNIETFHASQREQKQIIETSKGVLCWRESRPIEKVGIYIPGGSAPLFSTVLMLAVPARLAGCKEIVLCSPPGKNGRIDPAILFAAGLAGVSRVYAVGGIQAIGAMAFGTRSVPKVDKIFGPGNQYVTAAKQRAQIMGVAIDMPAGPSEVLVIADESGDPEFVAADLLSQAEHGADSQVILLSDNANLLERSLQELKEQLKVLPRKEMAQAALKNSKAILLRSIDDCVEFSNQYAPEHLILATAGYRSLIKKISNAGSVFLGDFSCESAGDYASGTNHTLPTSGYARSYSGVSLDSFVKKISFQELSRVGIKNIGPAIELMAQAEQLTAHKNAVTIRLKKLTK